jgi:hypothetical protein
MDTLWLALRSDLRRKWRVLVSLTLLLGLLAGRAPTAPDEIAVGEQTLRTIGARLGQTITVWSACRMTRRPAALTSPSGSRCPSG